MAFPPPYLQGSRNGRVYTRRVYLGTSNPDGGVRMKTLGRILKHPVTRIIGGLMFLGGAGSCVFAMEAVTNGGSVATPFVLFVLALIGGMVAIGDNSNNT